MTVSAAAVDADFVNTLLNMSAKQRWAMEVAFQIKAAEQDRWRNHRDEDTRRMLREGTWDQYVTDLKADARREVMAQQARRARTQTDEDATKYIKRAYPEHRIRETYQIGSEVYASLVGSGGVTLNVRYASGKVYGPSADVLEPA